MKATGASSSTNTTAAAVNETAVDAGAPANTVVADDMRAGEQQHIAAHHDSSSQSCIHTCIHAHMHTCTHAYMHTYMRSYLP